MIGGHQVEEIEDPSRFICVFVFVEVTVVKKAVLYIHGKGGNAEEVEHYKPFFNDYDVFGLDYKAATLWETREEIDYGRW